MRENQESSLSRLTMGGYWFLWTFPLEFPLNIYETRLLGRDFYTLKECFDALSNRYGISQSTLLRGAQRPRWYSFSSPNYVGSHNPPPFVAQRPCWHSFSSTINVGSHNPPPLGASIFASTSPGVHPPSRLNALVGTPPNVWL